MQPVAGDLDRVAQASTTQVSAPAAIGQAHQQIGTLLSLDQSLLIVWPQITALVALTVVCFAAAYVVFMRQEYARSGRGLPAAGVSRSAGAVCTRCT